MRPPAEGATPLALVIQRLMDADLLFPEEGSALLAEIEAFAQTRDEAAGGSVSESREPLLRMLEALQQTGRQGASVGEQARAIVQQILGGKRDTSEPPRKGA